MMQTLRRWFRAPYFADPDRQRRAGYINTIVWAAIFVLVPLIAARSLQGFASLPNYILLGTVLGVGLLRFLLGRGYLEPVGYGIVTIVWAALAYLAWSADGIRDVTFVALIVAALMAVLVVGWRAALVVLGLTILAGWGLAALEMMGLRSAHTDTGANLARDYTAILVMIGVLVYLLESSLTGSLSDARQVAGEAQDMNRELESLQAELAHRVERRTAELERSTVLANHRVEQLRAVSEVARRIAAVKDIAQLLSEVTQLISERFNYYHTGIFLLDERRQFAELRAASSEGGQRMLARQHRLSLEGTGIVPTVAATGRPRITADVAEDVRFLENPDLPGTRSEMSLPLRVGEQIIGVLDMQSTEPSAFAEEDIEVLQTLANQVAIALENARLFDETRQALRNVEDAYRGFLRQEWASFRQRQALVGVHFDGKSAFPIFADSFEQSATGDRGLVLPIMLHGDVVGELAVGSAGDANSWSEDDLSVLQAAVDRVAIALENARLVQATQDRALRERALSDMSSQIGAMVDFDAILQTAVQEVGKLVGGAEVIIQLTAPPDGAQ
jgi:GAF domain-containing protein